mmetsp:Transcript_140018/g.447819  ORF Transcript_140018/g.447819 Transcript_140018/m.447819 type:complete len:223 (-) Transcript_140018:540-1208(-)
MKPRADRFGGHCVTRLLNRLGQVLTAQCARPRGLQPMTDALLVEGVMALRDLDHIRRLPARQADGTLGRVLLSVLVPEGLCVVALRLQLLQSACWGTSRLSWFAGLPHGLDQQLVVPVREQQAEDAQQTTVDRVELQSLVEHGAPLLAARRLHQVEPEQHRADNEDVQRPIAQDQVDAIGPAEAMRSGLHEGHPPGDAGQEQGEPCHGEPEEIHKEHLGVVR